MVNCFPSKETDPGTGSCLFGRKARRRKATVEAEQLVVDQDEAADRGEEG